MSFSHQKDPDAARLRREAQDEIERLKVRVRDSEAFEAYVRDKLVPYLQGLAVAVPYAAPPDPPA